MSSYCPEGSFRYNSTLCGCPPGQYLPRSANGTAACTSVGPTEWQVSSGVGPTLPAFLTTVIPLDSIKRITQSQAFLLEGTLVVLALWLLFCFSVRLGRVDGGRTVWFRIRWWISRLDFAFATSHWLDGSFDQGKVIAHIKILSWSWCIMKKGPQHSLLFSDWLCNPSLCLTILQSGGSSFSSGG